MMLPKRVQSNPLILLMRNDEMTFEEWWASYWRTNGLPGIMNMAFKEIAQNAWDAATEQVERLQQEDVEDKFHLTFAEFHD